LRYTACAALLESVDIFPTLLELCGLVIGHAVRTAHYRLRAYCIWMFRDMKNSSKTDPLEHYFGLVREDGSLKPAAEAVRERWQRLEADPATAPHRIVARENVTMQL
jgi:hypothetical protein